jgi:hypothetical protein
MMHYFVVTCGHSRVGHVCAGHRGLTDLHFASNISITLSDARQGPNYMNAKLWTISFSDNGMGYPWQASSCSSSAGNQSTRPAPLQTTISPLKRSQTLKLMITEMRFK